MDEFYLKIQAPEVLPLEVLSDGVDPDLSTVSAVSLEVTRPGSPDLEEETWTASITAQSAEQLLLEHEWEESDGERVGVDRVMMVLTVPGGELRPPPVFFKGRYR